MNDLIFAFLCKNKTTLFAFLRRCQDIGLYESVHSNKIQKIGTYYVGRCVKEFHYEYADVVEWVFKVRQLIETEFPKIKYEYCYYGDDIVVNTDVDCKYIGVKYRVYKKHQAGGVSAYFCGDLEAVKEHLYKFISIDCKLDCSEAEIDALDVNFEALKAYCDRYGIEFTEVLHSYPNTTFDDYTDWLAEKRLAQIEEEENAQYEGIWYDDYDVESKLGEIDHVFEFLEHYYRHDGDRLAEIIKVRNSVEKIKENFIE